MADSFILKGQKDLVQNVGSATRINDPRGGNTFQFPKWWDKKQVQQYVASTVILIATDADPLKLVIPSTSNTQVKVVHDGSGNFTFPQFRGVDRVGVFNMDNELQYDYVFPNIVKGPIMKRTPAEIILCISFFCSSVNE